MAIQEYHRDPYLISTDPTRLNIPYIYEFLTTQTYWAQNRTLEVVRCSIENSLNFGIYLGEVQVGYARVITDYATFAWLCDVFVDPAHRKHGLGKWLVDCVVNHPDLSPLRRILLATRNAHELYRKYGGFAPLANVDRWMEKFNPNA
ncbi:MAG TPA: GNAT family N-acetyltransferase [Anaerolineales bacterium]